ncbi:hypothetical protein Ae201684_018343 [Aphanomyces euteiches]|uniref:Uncharacterized protein n=1 Tax=Aphanomyces euteiches TaxID=100861 RepID=A0A6G0W6A1_9STRA|nr:hypothetical protein Ae201684_018343 [Aphanomyces euteiches]
MNPSRQQQGGSKPGPSSNDQRSNVKNPNNPAHGAAQDNRADQKNPNNPAYQGGRKFLNPFNEHVLIA